MWKHKNTFAIGGLENVGYAPNQDYLLVLSSRGEGIFDCVKGEKVARRNNHDEWWQRFNTTTNSIEGFDMLEGVEVFTCGLYGDDNLSKVSADGWTLLATVPEPDESPFEKYVVQKIYLLSPDKKERLLVAKDGPCELRAFGLSQTGQSFILALSCELIIYTRNK